MPNMSVILTRLPSVRSTAVTTRGTIFEIVAFHDGHQDLQLSKFDIWRPASS